MTEMLVDDDKARLATDELLTVIAEKDLACLGAKLAMARGILKTLVCQSLLSANADADVHSELVAWVRNYNGDSSGVRSFAVLFKEPVDLNEEQFEATMWERLQAFANLDEQRRQPYNSNVSSGSRGSTLLAQLWQNGVFR